MPSTWEAIPAHKEAFSLPVVVQKAKQQNVGHRHAFEAVIRERIKELEFQNAVELLASVARLVPKEEIARNPKAQAALDLEWNKLLKKGTWDESRVKECREICKEARDRNEKVHLGRIFEACYEKGSELPEGDPMRKFKGRTVFQGNNVRDEDGMQALFAELGSSPASMEAAKLLDAFGSQPGFAKQQAEKNMSHGWKTIADVVDIGAPEPYDRYFGCHHREFSNQRLTKAHHPFAHIFEPQRATACQHRKNDYWHHDPATKTWTRVHIQPRKRLYVPSKADAAFGSSLRSQKYVVFDDTMTLCLAC